MQRIWALGSHAGSREPDPKLRAELGIAFFVVGFSSEQLLEKVAAHAAGWNLFDYGVFSVDNPIGECREQNGFVTRNRNRVGVLNCQCIGERQAE
jgi:hypothetical protein